MINGIINVYKEAGFTSFDVVAKLRGIARQKKIGHTGTLDPDATGVLPVCFGNATKLCEYLTDKVKEYEATFVLGITTDTQDISGKILEKKKPVITEEELTMTIMSFLGEQDQIPPMYSALKVDGKKLYELAREGKVVERKPRKITVHDIKAVDIIRVSDVKKSQDQRTVEALEDVIKELDEDSIIGAIIRVNCSKGTYIRTICHDIGEKQGSGATMTKLVRTKSGNFSIENALPLSELQRLADEGKLAEVVQATDVCFMDCDEVIVSDNDLKRVLNGNYITIPKKSDRIRVYSPDKSFLAVYNFSQKDNNYIPEKMFLS